MLSPNFQLEMINSTCNDMLNGKHQKSRVDLCTYLLVADCIQLNSCSWTDTTTYVKRYFKSEYVRSHYRLALIEGTLQWISMIGNTNFKPQLSKSVISIKRISFSLMENLSSVFIIYYI